MARWVRCKHPVDPTTRVYINLDQVVRITPVRGGAEITYAGSPQPILVGSNAINILADEDVKEA